MKTICYFVPYFGKLPSNIPLWLLSCKMNSTIDWFILTDDRTQYNFPDNVKVKYCSYEDVKKRIADHFDFPIVISKPWKLCDFRPAFGEIFKEELEGYDFWGHCDMDMLFGNIREFITQDLLEKYDKIGFQGHSTLYKNTPEVNSRYRTVIEGLLSYKEVFSNGKGYCFDEDGIGNIYKALGIDFYHKTNFAHLVIWTNSFFLGHLPADENYKNKRQVFTWSMGNGLRRHYLYNKEIKVEKYMYLHTFMRPITYKIGDLSKDEVYVIYPDVIKPLKGKLTYSFINRHGKCSAVRYYLKLAYKNRHKLTPKKVWDNFIRKVRINLSGKYK